MTAKKSKPAKAAPSKKSRGPKSHLEPSKRAVDDETIQGAKEMLDDGSDEEDGQHMPQAGKSTDFLLQLDEKGVSR